MNDLDCFNAAMQWARSIATSSEEVMQELFEIARKGYEGGDAIKITKKNASQKILGSTWNWPLFDSIGDYESVEIAELFVHMVVMKAYALRSDELRFKNIKTHPWLLYDAVDDSWTPNECMRLDGTVKRYDDPFWKEHPFPCGRPYCRCKTIALMEKQAREYIDPPEDVKVYRQGNLLLRDGRLEDAFPLLEKAFRLKPENVRYGNTYYHLRLSLGDISSIEDEFSYFERDIDSVIYSGRFDEWMRALIAVGQYHHAKEIVARIDAAISRLADGTVTVRHYGQQKPDRYAYERERFVKKAEKFLSRIQKLEAKAARASTPKSKARSLDEAKRKPGE